MQEKALILLFMDVLIVSGKNICPVKVETYNVFLGERFPEYSKRKMALPDALKNSGADVICIQEAFYGGDVSYILQSLKDEYPYSLSELHKQNGDLISGPPCSLSDLLVLSCLGNNSCLSLPTSEEQVDCAVRRCSAFTSLSQKCLTCTVLTGGNMANITANCITAELNFNSAGLLLLSKIPLSETRAVDYHPGKVQLRKTAYLQAKVHNLGEVLCTHLRHDSPTYFEYNLPYKSDHEQHSAEVQALLEATCEMDNVIIAGDLNCGPTVPEKSVSGVFEDAYIKMIRKGFVSPYVQADGRCTYCPSTNPLVVNWPTDILIDHLMTKGYITKQIKRKFDGPLPLSDHYGVEITIIGKVGKKDLSPNN